MVLYFVGVFILMWIVLPRVCLIRGCVDFDFALWGLICCFEACFMLLFVWFSCLFFV